MVVLRRFDFIFPDIFFMELAPWRWQRFLRLILIKKRKKFKKNTFFLFNCLCRSLFALRQTNTDTFCQFETFIENKICESLNSFCVPPVKTSVVFCCDLRINKTAFDMQTSSRAFIGSNKLEIYSTDPNSENKINIWSIEISTISNSWIFRNTTYLFPWLII